MGGGGEERKGRGRAGQGRESAGDRQEPLKEEVGMRVGEGGRVCTGVKGGEERVDEGGEK